MIKINGSTVLSVGGLCAALVGSVGYFKEANRIMLGANVTCLALAGFRRLKGVSASVSVEVPIARERPFYSVGYDRARGDDFAMVVGLFDPSGKLNTRKDWPNPFSYRQG